MKKYALMTACLFAAVASQAAEVSVTMTKVDAKGKGAAIGTVKIEETPTGLAFYPSLKGLSPGLHGFHVHENPSCAPVMDDGKMVPAKGAGGHLDPASTKRHGTPWGDGHLGDLPALYVAADGTATHPVLAPHLRLADVKKRSLMIHAGGDNYADEPKPLGGGGARVACGVVGN
ncbi:MAG: superoxide dismutase [Cu-Zn] SodC [Pseudomonadota bacterium]|nr:superoxide dismutase [Cu-Zn] SodC [Pseudomonadota bacterium]